MPLQDRICRRKSCRSFAGKPEDGETIEKILSFAPKPLYPQINARMDHVAEVSGYDYSGSCTL